MVQLFKIGLYSALFGEERRTEKRSTGLCTENLLLDI